MYRWMWPGLVRGPLIRAYLLPWFDRARRGFVEARQAIDLSTDAGRAAACFGETCELALR